MGRWLPLPSLGRGTKYCERKVDKVLRDREKKKQLHGFGSVLAKWILNFVLGNYCL